MKHLYLYIPMDLSNIDYICIRVIGTVMVT